MYQFITIETQDTVAVLTLNRPEKLNAWHTPMREEVVKALAQLGADDSVHAIILTGAGNRAFCAGQDLAETQQFLSGEQAADWSEGWKRLYDTIRRTEKPIIAALNGVAAGSAFQVALQADIRVGHSGSRMGQPEINSGIPTVLGAWLMNERIGLSRTIELTLTGRMMDGNEAHAIGLIHYLVAEDQVMAKANEVARDLAKKPPIAMKLNKRRFREITQAAFEEACRSGGQIQKQAFAAGEPQASMKKFFEDRARRKSAT
ncbi:MAG: enoyl-CoA hydratase/isomerase family protein [Proteobacteria bacterium]|nr:enoyl-CoA hydratase/isomerase family protein [Pseudomonadota bacterium]